MSSPITYFVTTALLEQAQSSPVASQQGPAVLADDRWTQVRSTAPMQSWTQALRRGMIEVAVEGTAHCSRTIVKTFRALGGHDRACLHRLCV